MTAAALWTAVKSSYEETGLIGLTNIRDRAATAIDDTFGQDAAQEVIDLWPVYAQLAYDADNGTHVAIAKEAVIAVLWRRGGTSTTIAEVKWDAVFSDSGTIARLRRTEPRGHRGPSSTATKDAYRGWSSDDSLPPGLLPRKQRRTY